MSVTSQVAEYAGGAVLVAFFVGMLFGLYAGPITRIANALERLAKKDEP